MSAGEQFLGMGTRFFRGVLEGEAYVYTKISNITEFGELSLTRGTVDDTDYDTEGGFNTFIGGMRDAGELPLTMKFRDGDSGQEALLQDYQQDLPVRYKIVWLNVAKTNCIFMGLVTSIGTAQPKDNFVTRSVSIKISGQPVFGNEPSNP